MKEYVVSKTDNIDIERVDEIWSSIERGQLVDNASGGEAEPRAEFSLAYSEEGLYFLFDVTDSAPKATMKEYNAPIYDEEAVEFFFATKKDLKDYLEVEFNAVGGVFAAHIDNDLKGHTSINFIEKNPIKSKVIAKDGGFYVVGLINKSAFKGEMDNWLFNAYRIKRRDDNSMILSAFSPTFVENFHKPDRFANLVFAE